MMSSYKDSRIKLQDIFNQDLLNCLPGVLYIYKIEEDGIKLKMWNHYFEETFQYDLGTYKDKPPFFFIDPVYAKIIKDAISRILKIGFVKEIKANVITKEGNSIPFVFNGYKFLIGEDDYFMGMGFDNSNLVSANKKIDLLMVDRVKIINEVKKKSKELLTMSIQENQRLKILNNVNSKIESILKQDNESKIKTELIKLNKSLKSQTIANDNWQDFKTLFINIHKDFFTNLKHNHPNLTEGEMQFCAYLKINMSSNDICSLLNISKSGLKKKRYRLKKKIVNEDNISLEEYLILF